MAIQAIPSPIKSMDLETISAGVNFFPSFRIINPCVNIIHRPTHPKMSPIVFCDESNFCIIKTEKNWVKNENPNVTKNEIENNTRRLIALNAFFILFTPLRTVIFE
jgi:hypothetical protein